MLLAHSGIAPPETITGLHHAPLNTAWLDLLNPTEAEHAVAERLTGLQIPSRADIEEIENSSRLSVNSGVLTLNTPVAYRDTSNLPAVTSVGFVLSEHRLVTVRFEALPVFASFATQFASSGAPLCGTEVFLRMMEAIVDRLADGLEAIGKSLDGLSRRIFHPPAKPARQDAAMRDVLTGVGIAGDAIGNIRNALLGVGRLLPYVSEMGRDFIPPALQPRLEVLERDVASLADFDDQLATKIGFLLDATLGFINIEQNNGIKVLTIVSIVGIPPTFIASLYGMNFKTIPELQWEWGYPYALVLMLVTALAPLVWFRIRGWL